MPASSMYDDDDAVRAGVEGGRHREVIGGLWDEIGRLQLEFMLSRGLKPGMRLLDIGCGCLRGGVHFVRYLEPGNYFGVDKHECLLEAGYERELGPAGLQVKLPRANLLADESFRFDRFGQRFDMAIALSVFTHLPIEPIGRCLASLRPVLVPGGTLCATVFECASDHDPLQPLRHEPGGIVTHGDRDPYHYRVEDLERAAVTHGYELDYVGQWHHPRDQRMAVMTRDSSARGG